ncbi:hypothetical protein MUP77_24735 [Candidatus Bathyarchaeota archaeon]|nr:hypothetical protein [Candidatus Bathyarchaeota archaeon]
MNIETEEDESLNPYINAGFVVRLKIQDLGRLEEFIHNLFGAELIFVKKAPKHVKLKIVKEAGGIRNDRSSQAAKTR